jgi:integrase
VRRLARKRLRTLPTEERERLEGLTTFHMNQTRHTFAYRWIEGGGSLDSLQQVLGHQDQRTTRRYGQPSDRYVREEALRVFANLTGKNTGNLASGRG